MNIVKVIYTSKEQMIIFRNNIAELEKIYFWSILKA